MLTCKVLDIYSANSGLQTGAPSIFSIHTSGNKWQLKDSESQVRFVLYHIPEKKLTEDNVTTLGAFRGILLAGIKCTDIVKREFLGN